MMRDIKTREGFEFWDKLNALPRYAFLLSPSGKSVQKFEDQAMGNWIDAHEAQKVVDQAQDEINQFRAERDALQLRLNAADQRIDELTTRQAESRTITLSGCEFTEDELVGKAVRAVTGTSRRGTLRWVAMKDAFGVGSVSRTRSADGSGSTPTKR